MNSSRVSVKGQITLPADIRRSLGLRSGDRVDFIRNADGKIELKPRTGTLGELRGILRSESLLDAKTIDTWIDEARMTRGGSQA
jgi:antitoxin PrlF